MNKIYGDEFKYEIRKLKRLDKKILECKAHSEHIRYVCNTNPALNSIGVTIKDATTSSATEGGNLVLASDDGAVMASGHRLGVIEFKGAEDTSNTLTTGARIEATTDAIWSASENGASLKFYTTDGNASESLVLTIDSDRKAYFTNTMTVSRPTSVASGTTG